MADTNRLLRLKDDEATGADLLRVWAQRYGGEVAMSLTELQDWLGLSAASGVVALTSQYASPNATGFNVLVLQPSTWLIMTPTAGFAAGTITFPLSSQVIDKSEILVTTTQQVTSATFDGNGASAVVGAPSSLAAADSVRFRYDAQGFTWYRVSDT